MRDINAKLASINDKGDLVNFNGDVYHLHTVDCELIARGEDCDCYGPLVLSEILDLLAATPGEEP